MKTLEHCQNDLRFEQGNRLMNVIAGLGFIGLAAYGALSIAKNKEYGIVPAVVGGGLALNEFHEAWLVTADINYLKREIASIESQ